MPSYLNLGDSPQSNLKGQYPLLERMESSPDKETNNLSEGADRRSLTSRDRIAQLKQLVRDTCQHPAGSRQRQRGLTQLIRLITPKLWHTHDLYYADALQQTWIYFCRNLCEATTGQAYNPDIAGPVTWLNAYLKRRLQDFQIGENRQRATTVSPSSLSGSEDSLLDPIDRLPAPPDIPPWLEQVQDWVRDNARHNLAELSISNHPTVTAQLLILKRLPPETPWKELAAEHSISVGTLSSFYQRQCLPQLREFGKAQGYF
ncbi:MAG: sigma-70 family RNA polymerase sigma factor [Phormidesmis sp.]